MKIYTFQKLYKNINFSVLLNNVDSFSYKFEVLKFFVKNFEKKKSLGIYLELLTKQIDCFIILKNTRIILEFLKI